MSKKSSPGDGSHSKGTKGGGMYGGHVAVADAQASRTRVMFSLARLARIARARHR